MILHLIDSDVDAGRRGIPEFSALLRESWKCWGKYLSVITNAVLDNVIILTNYCNLAVDSLDKHSMQNKWDWLLLLKSGNAAVHLKQKLDPDSCNLKNESSEI